MGSKEIYFYAHRWYKCPEHLFTDLAVHFMENPRGVNYVQQLAPFWTLSCHPRPRLKKLTGDSVSRRDQHLRTDLRTLLSYFIFVSSPY